MAQLELDEQISIESVKIFGFNNPQEMLISLVKKNGRCYVAVSRIRKNKDNNGVEKITYQNSIWIPLDFSKEIAQIIYDAAQEGEKLGWHDIDDGINQNYLLDLFDEDENFEEKFVVRRDARNLLTESVNFLSENFTLNVNVKAVVEKIKISGIRVIRAIEYLEDLGFIKQVESVDNTNMGSLMKLLEQPALPVINSNTTEILNKKIFERAMQMTNFTAQQAKDIDDFAEEGDPDFDIWNCAKNIAKIEIANVFINSQIPITFKITASGYDWLSRKNDEDIF